ncbi:MAG TPA: MerR family transcriptional regulator [Candidatus Gemmiger excrementavium]|uniref:MerR family transcriptional regulator n=1 Tax=Candidatus Gemmiger excrementavium TaxID=2838608 RepID=A0A9D2F3I4_9FIRM|nr:MerR family transcriptional regulator [Candidatus Gemmiger excrementavium]
MFVPTEMLFSIGQFARLHKINKKTLMWYDEIGLLKPAVVKSNGYRYYTFHQSSVLEVILMLRDLDVPISDIQTFLRNRSAATFETLLAENIAKIEQRIAQLTAMREILADKQQDMQNLHTLDLSQITVIEKEKPCHLVTLATSPVPSFDEDTEKIIALARKYGLHRLQDATYGAMRYVDKVCRGETGKCDFLYIQMPFPLQKEELHMQPKGQYLRAFSCGSWDNIPRRYQEMVAYARQNGLELYGFSYEKGINEVVTDTVEEYILQIKIPVRIQPNP